jgi:hypothetical protein
VITSEEILILREGNEERVRYEEILDVDHLTKEPIPEFIAAHLRSGRTLHIPVRNSTGEIFAIFQFVTYARREFRIG